MDDRDMWEEEQEALHRQEEKLQGKISDISYENYILNKVIDMMAEDLVKVPENDFMSDTQLSVVHYINANLDRRKQAVKEYYFKKARENKS